MLRLMNLCQSLYFVTAMVQEPIMRMPVAMAIKGEQCGQLLLREMDDNNSQILFLLVQQQKLEKALVLEYQSSARDACSKPPAKVKATLGVVHT
jgi:hypothetical protein